MERLILLSILPAITILFRLCYYSNECRTFGGEWCIGRRDGKLRRWLRRRAACATAPARLVCFDGRADNQRTPAVLVEVRSFCVTTVVLGEVRDAHRG